MADTAAPACGAEASYRKWRAELELKLTHEIKLWRAQIEANPPRMLVGGESFSVRTDQLDEGQVSTLLWLLVWSYLEAEIENFAAILLHRGIGGHDAVQNLRSWASGLVDSVRTYKWVPALLSVGVEDPASHWPQGEWSTELTSHFERVFWELDTDFPDATKEILWDAGIQKMFPDGTGLVWGWWEREAITKTETSEAKISPLENERRIALEKCVAEGEGHGIRITHEMIGQQAFPLKPGEQRWRVSWWLQCRPKATWDTKIRRALDYRLYLPKDSARP